MRGERDELALQDVGALERLPCLALLAEQARSVERHTGQPSERQQELALLAAEDGRERSRTHEQAPERKREGRELAVRRLLERAVLADAAPVRRLEDDPLRADNACHRGQHASGYVLLGRRRHELADRALHLVLRRPPPDDPDEGGRREPDQERERAQRHHEVEQEPAERPRVGSRDGEHECGRQRHRGDGERPHPPARDRCFCRAGTPEPHRDEEEEQRPVDEERKRVSHEPPRPRFALDRNAREHERADHEHGRERADEARERSRRRLERRREAVEEVRKEHEDREIETLEGLRGQRLRLLRENLGDDHDPRERNERERGPECRPPPLLAPELADGHGRDQREEREVDEPDEVDRKLHETLPCTTDRTAAREECE